MHALQHKAGDMSGFDLGLVLYVLYTALNDWWVFRHNVAPDTDRISLLRQCGGSGDKMAAIIVWALVTLSLGFAVIEAWLWTD